MDRWSKTKSRIWYGNHILILGWSEKTLYLLNELFEALRSSGEMLSIVILADREHSEMKQEVMQHFYQIWEDLSFFDRPLAPRSTGACWCDRCWQVILVEHMKQSWAFH